MGLAQRIDRALATIAPTWARRRAEARLRLELADQRREILAATYAAAERNRLAADWRAPVNSADQAIIPDSPTLNARARLAAANDWAAAAVIDGYRRHVVGIGISPRANARDPTTGALLDDFNRAADRLFYRWAGRAAWCDIERRKSWWEIQGLAIAEWATVGQSFTLRNYRRRREMVGLVLQMLEPEQLDLTRTYKNAQTGNEIRGGIEVDAYGAAVAYYFYTAGHPLELYTRESSERVPAERVMHLMRQSRPRQTYGVSRLAPVLRKLRHLQMYDEYQLVAARLEACIGAVIEQDVQLAASPALGVKPPAGKAATDAAGNDLLEFVPGMFPRLSPGEKVNWHHPVRPGQLYDPFVKAQLNHVAAGAGLDYPTVARDFTGATFSGQRQGMLERNAETDPLQALLIDALCQPTWEEFIALAVAEGRLAAPGFLEDPEMAAVYLQAEWQAPPKPWIDPQKQAMAAEIALRNGLATRRTYLNELGADWRETIAQLADEEAAARERGVQIKPAPAAAGQGPPARGGNRA